jgi:hypothetical protein
MPLINEESEFGNPTKIKCLNLWKFVPIGIGDFGHWVFCTGTVRIALMLPIRLSPVNPRRS